MSGRKIIFAALARDVAPFLKAVTGNIETFAARFSAWAVVVVENDSRDNSKALLKAWVEKARALGAVRASLIEMDGLALQHPVRTDRIAVARNRILQEIGQDPVLSRFDYLAMLDTDLPNAVALSPEQFCDAAAFLDQHCDVAGVFANQMPLYYDIWALRAENWCPRDCWQEVGEASPSLAPDVAVAKYVYGRQRYIDPASSPIAVDSAFGGIGIYRLASVLGHRYAGLKPDGEPVCEHVAFHESIGRAGGKLFILPGFLNLTSFEHTGLSASHNLMPVRVGEQQVSILVARGSAFVVHRGHYPLFGERFAALARLQARRGDGVILDLGVHQGESLVLARLHGCDRPYIGVESRELEFSILSANALMHDGLFADRRLLRAIPSDLGNKVGLVRLGTGNDAPMLLAKPDLRAQPLLWARIEGPQEADAWQEALQSMAHEDVMVFNAPGVLIAAGPLAGQKEKLGALFTRLPHSAGGLDLAFFAASARDIFREFRASFDPKPISGKI